MSVALLKLPSLDLIRGFVAVGRRMSITLAAQDLCLTQSAVSRQVQALEEALGVQLLRRGYRSVAFTPNGERLFRSADSALQMLQDAVGHFKNPAERPPVTITASIGVTALWLLPRLGSFQSAHPTIDVRVAATNKLLDLRTENIDLAIRYCEASDAPENSARLFGESVVPVAHPSLAGATLDSPQAIASQVLIEYDDPGRPWLHWNQRLAAAGLDAIRPKQVLRFNQYDQAIQAALAAQGIALGRLPLVEPLLAQGRLVRIASPTGAAAPAYAYWLVRLRQEARPDVTAVVTWILAQAREFADESAPAPACQ